MQIIEQAVAVVTPVGSVAWFFGTRLQTPVGWLIADGSNGTPNLNQYNVMGTSVEIGTPQTGGSTSNFTLNGSAGDAHTHTVNNTISGANWSHHHNYRGSQGDGYPDAATDSISSGNSQSYDRKSQRVNFGSGSHNHATITTASSGANHTHTQTPTAMALWAIIKT
jgi:hypothetical protein